MAFKMNGFSGFKRNEEEVYCEGGDRLYEGKWGTKSRKKKRKKKDEEVKKTSTANPFDGISDALSTISMPVNPDAPSKGSSLVTQPHIKASGFAYKNKKK